MNMGICGVLLIVFITLKLFNLIAWSWMMVFTPLWVALMIAVVAGVIYLLVRTLLR